MLKKIGPAWDVGCEMFGMLHHTSYFLLLSCFKIILLKTFVVRLLNFYELRCQVLHCT